jgi:hypothetical protein
MSNGKKIDKPEPTDLGVLNVRSIRRAIQYDVESAGDIAPTFVAGIVQYQVLKKTVPTDLFKALRTASCFCLASLRI